MTQSLTVYNKTELPDGTLMFWGTEPMLPPLDAKHVRACSLFLPGLPKTNSVQATVFSTDSIGTMFAVWSIQQQREPGYTQVTIHAQNVQIGKESNCSYFLNWLIIGTP